MAAEISKLAAVSGLSGSRIWFVAMGYPEQEVAESGTGRCGIRTEAMSVLGLGVVKMQLRSAAS